MNVMLDAKLCQRLRRHLDADVDDERLGVGEVRQQQPLELRLVVRARQPDRLEPATVLLYLRFITFIYRRETKGTKPKSKKQVRSQAKRFQSTSPYRWGR